MQQGLKGYIKGYKGLGTCSRSDDNYASGVVNINNPYYTGQYADTYVIIALSLNTNSCAD